MEPQRFIWLYLASLIVPFGLSTTVVRAQDASAPAVSSAPPAGASPSASATPPPPPSGAIAGGVAFDRLDESTVRIFAVRHVGMETVRGERVERVIALPESGHGSGVLVDPRGVVATAKHVIEGARHLAVRFPGSEGAVLPASVAYVDDELDFALLLVHTDTRLPHYVALPTEPQVLPVRSTVDAVGYPLDADRDHPQSSRGIISGALDDGHLQLDISVNPGNSGGPLLFEGKLVGLVVARGNVDAGVQGIGIAVPIAPIRAAYDRARSDGALSRAYAALRTDVAGARQIAQVVDGIVRLGDIEILREAAALAEDQATSQRLQRFEQLAQETRDPDLLALLSAFFWDAAQIMMEVGGGTLTPSSMPAGPARGRAERFHRLALELARRAVQSDETTADRSPFIAYLARRSFDPGETTVAGSWQRAGHDTSAMRGPRYRMVTLLGLMVPVGVEDDFGDREYGSGAQLTALFPFSKLDYEAKSRVAPFLGVSADLYGWSSSLPVQWFVGPELGLMMRFGRYGGIALMAAWTPGAHSTRVEAPREDPGWRFDDCERPDGSRGACRYQETVGSFTMFHFALLAKADRVLFGAAVRVGRPLGGGDRYLVIAPTFGGNF